MKKLTNENKFKVNDNIIYSEQCRKFPKIILIGRW
jgi:hypothetical protein